MLPLSIVVLIRTVGNKTRRVRSKCSCALFFALEVFWFRRHRSGLSPLLWFRRRCSGLSSLLWFRRHRSGLIVASAPVCHMNLPWVLFL